MLSDFSKALEISQKQYLVDYFELIGVLQEEFNKDLKDIMSLKEIIDITPLILTVLGSETLLMISKFYIDNYHSFQEGDLLKVLDYAKQNPQNISEFFSSLRHHQQILTLVN